MLKSQNHLEEISWWWDHKRRWVILTIKTQRELVLYDLGAQDISWMMVAKSVKVEKTSYCPNNYSMRPMGCCRQIMWIKPGYKGEVTVVPIWWTMRVTLTHSIEKNKKKHTNRVPMTETHRWRVKALSPACTFWISIHPGKPWQLPPTSCPHRLENTIDHLP